jgi:hypothetical protein
MARASRTPRRSGRGCYRQRFFFAVGGRLQSVGSLAWRCSLFSLAKGSCQSDFSRSKIGWPFSSTTRRPTAHAGQGISATARIAADRSTASISVSSSTAKPRLVVTPKYRRWNRCGMPPQLGGTSPTWPLPPFRDFVGMRLGVKPASGLPDVGRRPRTTSSNIPQSSQCLQTAGVGGHMSRLHGDLGPPPDALACQQSEH